MNKRRLWSGLILGAQLLFCTGAARAECDFVVIVHPENPTSTVDRADLDRAYRRRLRLWPDGKQIVPVNASFGHPCRGSFSKKILRASADSLVTFWNRRYFQGIVPPTVLKSPAAIRAYVARTRGAVGYIPVGDVDGSVRVIQVSYEE